MVIKGFSMKKHLIIGIVVALIALPSYAKIIETTASGTGASEYAATMDAIDNAVRQTHKVDVKNDKGVEKVGLVVIQVKRNLMILQQKLLTLMKRKAETKNFMTHRYPVK